MSRKVAGDHRIEVLTLLLGSALQALCIISIIIIALLLLLLLSVIPALLLVLRTLETTNKDLEEKVQATGPRSCDLEAILRDL